MDNAVTLVPDATQFRDGFRQDIVHAVIVGSIGQTVTTPDAAPCSSGTRAPRRSRP